MLIHWLGVHLQQNHLGCGRQGGRESRGKGSICRSGVHMSPVRSDQTERLDSASAADRDSFDLPGCGLRCCQYLPGSASTSARTLLWSRLFYSASPCPQVACCPELGQRHAGHVTVAGRKVVRLAPSTAAASNGGALPGSAADRPTMSYTLTVTS